MTPDAIWQAVLGELQLTLHRPVYDNWLRDTSVVAFEDGCFLIAVRSAFAQDMLATRMKSMIKQRLQRIAGQSVDVQFVVRPETVQPAMPDAIRSPLLQNEQTPSDNHRSSSAMGVAPGLIRTMTFDNFIEGEGNRLAHAAAQAVCQDPGNHYNPLFLYGGVGLGKTHLLHAIGNHAANAGFAVRYVTSETFTNDLVEAIRTKSNVAFRQTYREVDVLLIDDIQFIEGRPGTQTEVFNTFNSLYAARKQIVLASDRPPNLLSNLEERLQSRFGGGLVADMQPPDLEHRMAILQAKAYEMGRVIPDETLRYIAERFQSNVRELQGALTRVTAYAYHNGRAPDAHLVREILGDHNEYLDKDPAAILQAVSDEYRISPAELLGARRIKRVVVPRQVAMYLMRELSQMSFPQIGEYLGGRDHTTAMHGHNKIEGNLADDGELRAKVERVKLRLYR
ncbi:MAG: chromosomal replication initiator protein DnaA [Caldilineales bacterium]|nr:chromosomal replication initiator protein DnaA [Caldilineales bacterium]